MGKRFSFQSLRWASKSGATSPEEADAIHRSYIKMSRDHENARTDQPADERIGEALAEMPKVAFTGSEAGEWLEKHYRTIKAALMSHNLTRPDAHVKNSEGNEREKDRVIREMAEALGYYANGDHIQVNYNPQGTYESYEDGTTAKTVLTKPENAAVIEGVRK